MSSIIDFLCKCYKSTCFFVLFCVFINSYAQQLPLHNQYIYNPLIINPSFAGVPYVPYFNLTTKSQWIGFADGISTVSLSGNYPLSESQGIGGTIFQDNISHDSIYTFF